MKHLRLSSLSKKEAGKYCALFLGMLLLHFALPQREPLSFALFSAAIFCGFQPLVCAAEYLVLSAVPLSAAATLSAAIQAAILLLASLLYRRFHRKPGLERAAILALAQIPFVFLFPHTGYGFLPLPVIWQKVLLSVLIFLLSVLFEGAIDALQHRVFRCRLPAGQLTELSLLWIFGGLGVCNALGDKVFFALSLTMLLLSAVLLKNASAVPFAVILSLPLCLYWGSALPVAEYALFSCICLLFCPYGKLASAFALLPCFLVARFLSGLYAEGGTEIVFTLLSGLLPVLLCACLPEKLYSRVRESLLFYRERSLPRIAINRNRRAVGERLYEVSSLFREIEGAFSPESDRADFGSQLCRQLRQTLCASCPGRKKCENSNAFSAMNKLVAVGCAKGQVTLVDLPSDLNICGNAAGLLFALNHLLAQYRGAAQESESARESRRLLAEQAHGVSEILRNIALEQSEEFVFSDGEQALSRALATAGILSSEIFVYGEGNTLTVSLTLTKDVNGKLLSTVAGEALGIPLSLSEKIPLSPGRSCYVLKRKPAFDAAFGIASRCKDGESANGDTYSVLKIDERRFLVALSDGMGSGAGAREISDRTLTLLESFYKAKMPSETVLSTVNRLISYSSDEMFACLDLAAVDLDTGEADIVKIGAPVGFILSDDEMRVLEGESLPMGMLDAIHPATMQADMKANDFMIFMSDGVTAAFGSAAELYSYLSALRPLNPQSLAEEILGNALARHQGTAQDDMTVLAVKLMKTA